MPTKCTDSARYTSEARNATLDAAHVCADRRAACARTAYAELPQALRPVASLVDPRRAYNVCAEYAGKEACRQRCRGACARVGTGQQSTYAYNATVRAATPAGRVDERYEDQRVNVTGATHYCPEPSGEYRALVVGLLGALCALAAAAAVAAAISAVQRRRVREQWRLVRAAAVSG